MRILVAPQEFKGTLTAASAAAAIAEGARRAVPGADVRATPLSDGGPGLVEVLVDAAAGDYLTTSVHDPLMRPVMARWGRLSDGTAVIEMAAASGLTLVAPDERNALAATTYGTGELIRAALDADATRILLGIGGSATTDAGAGAMHALGARLLDAAGVDLPEGGVHLQRLARFDLSGVDRRLRSCLISVATDVRNPLVGAEGAARVYAPQKGATPAQVDALERALARFAEVARAQLGIDLAAIVGGGAAGGLACGLLLVSEARIEPGFDLVARTIDLDAQIRAADIVLTGEGRLDEQTSFGKTVAGVARMARAAGKRVGVVAGSVAPRADRTIFDDVEACDADGGGLPPSTGAAARDAVIAATQRLLARVLSHPERR